MKFLITTLFLYLTPILNAQAIQDSALVHINFAHANEFEIRVDKRIIYTENSFYLTPGEHFIEIWNAGLENIQDTITISKGNENYFSYVVQRDERLGQYKKDMLRFRRDQLTHLALSPALLLTTGTMTVINFLDGRNRYNDLVEYNNSYSTSTDYEFLANYESEFYKRYGEYDRVRKQYYIFLGSTILFGACTYFSIRRFKRKVHKPVNQIYISPFTHKDYSLDFKFGINSVGLVLNI